ncbi:MAG: class C sortase [Peptococcaceae bacterium]|nr:class C sortase [Peptococcaceae bacterium]
MPTQTKYIPESSSTSTSKPTSKSTSSKSTSRTIIQVAAALIFLAGIGIFAYPYIMQLLYDRGVTAIVHSFEADRQNQDPRLEALYQKMIEENQSLYENGQMNLVDPFSYEQPGLDLTEYGLSDNIMGYISIPKIEVLLPIHLGASTENMKQGAVHLTQTSYSVGGPNTNSVIAAHRGYSKALMFRKIDLLEIGDSVKIRNFREELDYEVTDIKIIDPHDSQEILIQPEKELVTLMSCHPFPGNKLRYLVYCERVTGSDNSGKQLQDI